ncbi:MAG: ComEC/Rec2 family competence protein [Patescibacteria group bacterium]
MTSFSPADTPLYIRWACFGFLGGVLLHAIRPFDVFPVWIPIGLCTIGIVLCYSSELEGDARRRPYALRPTAYALIFLALGIWRFDATIPMQDTSLRLGESVTMEGIVKDIRTYDDVIAVTKIDDTALGKNVLVSFARNGIYPGIGEYWRVSCRLESYQDSQEKTRLMNARQGVFYRCKGAVTGTRIRVASPWNVEVPLAAWRSLLTKRILRLLPGDPGALLAGMLYGDRGLSQDAAASFRFAGMTHIIAVSGSNITIVVSVLVPALIALGYRRRSAVVIAGAGIILFSLFAGAGSSVIRAAIMGWLAILACVFGRRANVAHLLLLAAATIIIFDPWALAFDAGFALSFLATWGLLVFARPAQQVFRFIPEWFGLREAFATTFSATIATAPYLMWQFQSFSLAGLATNLFALPIVSLTMAWGAIGILCGDISHLFVLPAEGCLRFMLLVADLSMHFPFLGVPYHMPLALMILCYGVLCLLAYVVRPFRSYTQKRVRLSVHSSEKQGAVSTSSDKKSKEKSKSFA